VQKERLRKRRDSIVLLFIVLILTACETLPEIEPIEINKPIEVYFCPRDNCEEALITQINKSTLSIHCAFFDIDLENLIAALNKKSRSLDVRLVIDSDNHFNQTRGIPTVMDDKKQLTHNKFCIIDNRIIITGSFNPTKNGNEKNNNNMLIIHSRFLAENYEDEFKELWKSQFGSGEKVKYREIEHNYKKIENYFCPEDRCSQHLINHILDANHSIHFMLFTFTDEDVADAILFSNTTIKGIMEKMQGKGRYSQYQRLKDFKIDVQLDSNPKMMHHKVFIIDNRTVITGSYNPTSAGDKKNDENMLVIHDKNIAEKFMEEFKKLSNQQKTI
jgi:phosphatidylserine/phosphatidylglycerophosphate/cardiolipin synthase-like enzyme